MLAKAIIMMTGKDQSVKCEEIDQIYISGCTNPGWFKKATIYDYLIEHPESIKVDHSPYPFLIPVKSINGEKFVRSEPDYTKKDNLLNLPKYKK